MNDDLISRQSAIDILDAYEVMVENGEENPYAWAILRMIELPSAQQWIPCREQMPEEEGVYIATFDKSCLLDNELPVMDVVWRDGQWQYSVLESYEHRMPKLVIEPIEELKVIAWMPLPPAFKEEEKCESKK